MEREEIDKESKDWETKILLTHYKRLSNCTLEAGEKEIKDRIKQKLLENGISEETINQEVLEYKELSEEELRKQIEEKLEGLVSKINTYLEATGVASSKDYPELYHRIQELLALNPTMSNQLLKEAFEIANIENHIDCSSGIYGDVCSYCFSRKPTYKKNV